MGYKGNLLSVSFDKGIAQMGMNGANSRRREDAVSQNIAKNESLSIFIENIVYDIYVADSNLSIMKAGLYIF